VNEFRINSLERAQDRRSRAPMPELRLGMIVGGEKPCRRSLSVVAPCYNEALGLVEFHRRVRTACDNVVTEYEIVLVNDGSRDNTWSVMNQLAAADPHVVAINLARNYGHQTALTAGLQFARGERVLIIDADLQDPPELLGSMMHRMDEGADVVYGQREIRQGEHWFKRTTASLFYRILGHLIEIEIPRDAGDFRLLSRRAVEVLNSMPEHDRFIRGMVSWIGLRQVPLSYVRAPRFAGASNYPFRKMLRFAVDAITGFSIRPLRLASYLGGLLGIVGVSSMIYIIGGVVVGHVVQGWASVMTAVVLLSSCQLVMLGVVGEYLGRLYIQAKNRPLFLVAEIVSAAETGNGTAPCCNPGSETRE
jgi:glycosyltransferase involved in cell wall biosynthesis